MTLKELKQQAKELGIKGYSRMKKEELEKSISAYGTLKSAFQELSKVPSIVGLAPSRAATVLKGLPKGIRRKVRKEAFNAGYRGLAGIR